LITAVLAIAGAVSLNKGYLALLGIGVRYLLAGGCSHCEICARGRCKWEGCWQAGLCAVFDRKIQSKRYSLFCLFFPQFIAISRDFTTSITTLCLLWILFDFAVMAGYIVAIKRFPVTQVDVLPPAALFLLPGRGDCLEPGGKSPLL
jgi:hypothetical protein